MIKKLKGYFRQFRIFCIDILAGRKRMNLPESAVILAPHPDDETFGCGQLIAAMCSQGKSVHIIVLSGGAGSHQGCSIPDFKDHIFKLETVYRNVKNEKSRH